LPFGDLQIKYIFNIYKKGVHMIKKILPLFILVLFSSCASIFYKNSQRKIDNNTIHLNSENLKGFKISTENEHVAFTDNDGSELTLNRFKKNENPSIPRFANTSTSSASSTILLEKFKKKGVTLYLSDPMYDTIELNIKRNVRIGVLTLDVVWAALGITGLVGAAADPQADIPQGLYLSGGIGYFSPLIIDLFSSNLYKLRDDSKYINVKFEYRQSYMREEYDKIASSMNPKDFETWLEMYPNSEIRQSVADKKDSIELVIALSKELESAIDEYLESHKGSTFYNEAKNIKNEMVAARELFTSAFAANTVEAYEEFLLKFPKSIQNKQAIDKLVDAAFKRSVKQNKLESMLQFNSNYLLKYQKLLNSDTLKSKTEKTVKLVDLLIVKENDTDPLNKYVSYSKVWKKFDQVRKDYPNLAQWEYKNVNMYYGKVANLVMGPISKLASEYDQKAYLSKLETDFPNYNNPLWGPLIVTLIESSDEFTGTIKLFNQKVIDHYVENGVEGMPIKELDWFEYKGTSYFCSKDADVELMSLTNGKISAVKLFKNNTILSSGIFRGKDCSYGKTCDSYECSYFVNGSLVQTNYMNQGGYYTYEFENGVNLSLKNLENKIKEGDAELAKKNFDRAIEIYTVDCMNNFPGSIPQNVRVQKSIQNASSQKAAYLQKMEQDRIAEEKRLEQQRIAEEKRQERARIAEESKVYEFSEADFSDYGAQNVGKIIIVPAFYSDAGNAGAWADVGDMTLRSKGDIFENNYSALNFYYTLSDGATDNYRRRVKIDGRNINLIIPKNLSNKMPNTESSYVWVKGKVVNYNTIEVRQIVRKD